MILEKALNHGEHGAHGGKPEVKARELLTRQVICFQHRAPCLFAVSAVLAVVKLRFLG
jgi:hypothetical protein